MPTNCDTQVLNLLNRPLSQHSWNYNKSKLAVCPNSEEIIVFKKEGAKWIVEDILKEHDQLITGLDWCHKTNKIITCSMDRNAFVWVTDETGRWKPTLVALRISKGATCVNWNAEGTKFAVGSSNGSVVVGHFEEENDWWLCKHIKVNTENTITSISWHPNGIDLVIGSIDGTLLLASGYIKAIDKNALLETVYSYSEKITTPILDVTFSPSGDKIAYLTHDSNLIIVNLEDNNYKLTLSLGELSMLQVKFISDSLIVTTGHNYTPSIIGLEKSSKKWTKIDDLIAIEGKKPTSSSSAFGSAFAKFKSMDDCGVNDSKFKGIKKSGHKNTITKLSLLKSNNETVSEISTSSLDGNLITWDMKNILTSQKFSDLKI